jgi:hypothetical protein
VFPAGGNAAKPLVDIRGSTLAEDRAEFEATWETLLRSLATIPFAPEKPRK